MQKLLDRKAREKLIISKRFHVAFPCFALKIPIILVKYKYFDLNLFSGLFEFLNTIGKDKNGYLELKVILDKYNKVVNSNQLKKIK